MPSILRQEAIIQWHSSDYPEWPWGTWVQQLLRLQRLGHDGIAHPQGTPILSISFPIGSWAYNEHNINCSSKWLCNTLPASPLVIWNPKNATAVIEHSIYNLAYRYSKSALANIYKVYFCFFCISNSCRGRIDICTDGLTPLAELFVNNM